MAYPSPRRLQLRRGNAAAVASYLGFAGELVVDTTNWTLYVHDGVTVGGRATTTNTASITSNITAITNGTALFGNLIPSANIAYTLGNITHQWRELWVSNTTIFIGGVPLSIDVTGNLTINGNTIPTVEYVNAEVANVTVDLSAYALTANVTAANVGMQGYVDQANTIQSAQVSAANLNITAANIGMKGYVDQQITNIVGGAPGLLDTLGEIANVLLSDEGNITTLTNSINSLQANLTQANLGMTGYVDQANTIQSNQIIQANVGMKGYVDNAVSTIVIPVTYSNANVASYLITNGYVNTNSAYSNANVTSYLPTHTGNVGVDYLVGTTPNISLTAGTFTSTFDTTGNVILPNAYISGNVTASYIFGNGAFLSGIVTSGGSGTNYSNVNVQAYTETMGFTNFSNVNVAAFITTNGLTNYSNVNVAAYTQTQGYTNYSNVNVAAYLATNDYLTNTTANLANYAWNANITGAGTNYSNVNVKAYTETMGFANYSNVNVAAYVSSQGLTSYSNVQVATYLPTYSGNIANVRLSSSGALTFPDGTQQTTAAFGGGSNYGNANVAAFLPTYTGTTGITQVGTLATLSVTGNATVGNLVGTEANTRIISNIHITTFDIYGNVSFPGNVIAPTFVGSGSLLSGVATKTTGSWTVTEGTNNYSFTVPSNNSYQLWVQGNIPNGIIVYNATVSVSNTNVPVIGQQFAWNYEGGGNPLLLTSIPAQIIGTAGTISNATPSVGSTTNEFVFGISNTSGSSQIVYWGYVTL